MLIKKISSLLAVAALLSLSIFNATPTKAASPYLQVNALGQNQYQISLSSAPASSSIDIYSRQGDSTLWNALQNFGYTNSYGNFNGVITLNTFHPELTWYIYAQVAGQSSNVVSVQTSTTPSLYIVTSTLPTAYVGSYYQTTITATGGLTPYSYSVVSGSLPQGITLSSNGTIQGYPQYGGNSNFTIQVQDSASHSATQAFSINSQGQQPNQPPPSSIYQDGTLILDRSTVYNIYRGQKIGFTTANSFTGLGYKWTNLYGADISSIPMATAVVNSANDHHAWGTWVLGGQTVYYVHELGLIPITSYDIFLNNGGQSKFLVPINWYDMQLPQLAYMTYNDSRLNDVSGVHTMTVQLGNTFTISLNANPSTGYDWQPSYSSTYLRLLNRTSQPNSNLIGAGVTEQFQFQTLQRGQTTLQFVYQRPWESSPINQETYSIIIQ